MMQKKQIIFLTAFLFIGASYNGIAQEKGDIGLLLSPLNLNNYGLEYRKPMGESFHFKIGLNMEEYNYRLSDPEILSVTDSSVIQRRNYARSDQWGFRIGAERRLKSSAFSLGADLNFHYRKKQQRQWNEARAINEQGEWVHGIILEEGDMLTEQDNGGVNFMMPIVVGDYGYADVRQHFFVPSLRTSINMNLPISKMFLLHLSAAASFGVPIYMGESDSFDPENVYMGSPPSIFEFDTSVNIGLRYNIGAFKKKRALKMSGT